jgi:type II secretory pathway pseudopilin PulG
VELLVVIVIIGILAALLLPAIATAIRNAKVAACANNQSQLWKMANCYMVQFGGPGKLLPVETGGAFWLKLSQTTPPLIDASLKDIFGCPVKGSPPAAGTTDYRGPAANANAAADGEIIGADKVGNHGTGYGGNVIRKSGDVQTVAESDPLWIKAGQVTIP